MNKRDRERFDNFLEETIAELPDYVQEQLKALPIIVEDEPSADIQEDMEIDGDETDLCGLHSGIPLTEQSVLSSDPTGSLIMIFRGPVMRLAGSSDEELRKQIRITLLHEIAHHFGFSEEELEAIGYG